MWTIFNADSMLDQCIKSISFCRHFLLDVPVVLFLRIFDFKLAVPVTKPNLWQTSCTSK